jgi:hypothetical protein
MGFVMGGEGVAVGAGRGGPAYCGAHPVPALKSQCGGCAGGKRGH